MSNLLTLNPKEEEKVVEELKKEARIACSKEIKEFVDCAQGRLVSVAWACHSLSKSMNKCLQDYGKTNAIDRIRLKHLREKQEKISTKI